MEEMELSWISEVWEGRETASGSREGKLVQTSEELS